MRTTVDARRLACPQPVVLTSRAITASDDLVVIVDNAVAVENVSRFARSRGFSVERSDRDDGIYLALIRNRAPGTNAITSAAADAGTNGGADKRADGGTDARASADASTSTSTTRGATAIAAAAVGTDTRSGLAAGEGEGSGTREAASRRSSPAAAQPDVVVFVASDSIGRGPAELGERLTGVFFHTLLELGQRPKTIILMNSGVKLAVEGSRAIDDLRALAAQGVDIVACGTCLGYFELTDKLAVGRVSNMYEIAGALMEARRVVQL